MGRCTRPQLDFTLAPKPPRSQGRGWKVGPAGGQVVYVRACVLNYYFKYIHLFLFPGEDGGGLFPLRILRSLRSFPRPQPGETGGRLPGRSRPGPDGTGAEQVGAAGARRRHWGSPVSLVSPGPLTAPAAPGGARSPPALCRRRGRGRGSPGTAGAEKTRRAKLVPRLGPGHRQRPAGGAARARGPGDVGAPGGGEGSVAEVRHGLCAVLLLCFVKHRNKRCFPAAVHDKKFGFFPSSRP